MNPRPRNFPPHQSRLPVSFDDLCARHPLRPIHDDDDYERAAAMLDRLAILEVRTRDQDDYLTTLTILVERYDEDHYARDLSLITVPETLAYLCKQNGMNGSALGKLLGNRSLGSKVLRGERELSKAHIRILCERFAVSADLFLDTGRQRRSA